jgi:hypothetical protein
MAHPVIDDSKTWTYLLEHKPPALAADGMARATTQRLLDVSKSHEQFLEGNESKLSGRFPESR